MPTFEQSGVCKRDEYDEILGLRRFEEEIQPEELIVMYFAVRGHDTLAYRLATRVVRIGSMAKIGTANAFDLEICDDNYGTVSPITGVMVRGLWNYQDVQDGENDFELVAFDHGPLSLIDGCASSQDDDFEQEHKQMMEGQLVRVRNNTLRS